MFFFYYNRIYEVAAKKASDTILSHVTLIPAWDILNNASPRFLSQPPPALYGGGGVLRGKKDRDDPQKS